MLDIKFSIKHVTSKDLVVLGLLLCNDCEWG